MGQGCGRAGWRAQRRAGRLLALGLLLAPGARSVSAQPVILMSKGLPSAAFDAASGFIESPQTVSADGRYVVFTSSSTNVVPGQADGNGAEDVFLFDRITKDRFLVSHVVGDDKKAGSGQSYAGKISSDGKWVVFTSLAPDLVSGFSDANGPGGTDVFLYEVSSGKVVLVSHADGAPTKTGDRPSGENGDHSIAADGSFVSFTSEASDLAPGQADANGASDVFAYDTANDKMFLVSHTDGDPKKAANGGSDNSVVANGPDGVFVTYESTGDDLVAGQSDDGASKDIFLYELRTEVNLLVSGRFGSTRVTAGSTSGPSRLPTMDQKAGFVFFITTATNLVSGVSDVNDARDDVYRYDRGPGTLELVSHSAVSPLQTGNNGSGGALAVAVDQVGAGVAFVSQASDLVAALNDNNAGGQDVFLWDSGTGSIVLVSRRPGDARNTGNDESYVHSVLVPLP